MRIDEVRHVAIGRIHFTSIRSHQYGNEDTIRLSNLTSRALRWLQVFVLGNPVLLSIPVGIVAGLGAIAFVSALDFTGDVVLVHTAGYSAPRPGAEGNTNPNVGASATTRQSALPSASKYNLAVPAPGRRWLLICIPALGGLLSGLLVYTFAPEAEGHGTDAVVEAFHIHRGEIRRRVPLIKTVASVLTIGTGGSAGREGPIGQIGAGFGSALATWLKTGERERRLLMLAGAGTGIGAVFRAPLGGALFMTEVLYRDMEFESAGLVLTFVASIVAYSLYCAFTGVWGPIFSVPALQFSHPLELPLYAMLGVACAIVGTIYVKVFYGIRNKIFRPMRIPNHFKPAIGGLAIGAIALFLPQILGTGYGWVQMAVDGHLPLQLAAGLIVLKIIGTGLTISSGGSGGVFGPSIVIGGCLGATMGATVEQFFPGVIQPSAFVLVGMAGFFAGVAKCPISSLVMVSEMTTGYGLLVPLMLTTAVAYLLTPASASIYEKQVHGRVDSPAHEGEFVTDVLEQINVAAALQRSDKTITFRPDTPLSEILATVSESNQQVFPIVNPDQSLQGVIDFEVIRMFLTVHGMAPKLLVATDLRAVKFDVLAPEEDLALALRKIQSIGLDELPVVQPPQDGHAAQLLGMLSRRDIVAAYHKRMYTRSVA